MIKLGLTDKVELGNLEAKRDWGHSKDYVRAMWLMLQQNQPDDYVICTGKSHSVREFCEKAFSCVGLDYKKYVVTLPKFFRPAEVDVLVGDYSKAKKLLGWEPTVSFDELIAEMVENDLQYHLKKDLNKGKLVLS
jgi:GDPmannose 4,6-dehydratase